MCLAIPGKVLSKEDRDGALMGRVDFGGITREVQLDFVPEVEVGEYVIVHVGFALSRLDAEEAARTLELLKGDGSARRSPRSEVLKREVRSPVTETRNSKIETRASRCLSFEFRFSSLGLCSGFGPRTLDFGFSYEIHR